MNNTRRIGTFFVANKFLTSAVNDQLKSLFGQLVVVKAEPDYMTDRTQYWAFCDKFRQVDHGEITPTYDVVIDSGKNSISFVEVKR